ncbi:MAG: rhomboid family intramembrane serine protease [Chromatiales bacterium]|jgi:membrane associated rhomboid family serine protease|nr:rhomboid family intramembrane serine protease [Chromatiales bacterium]
MFFFPYRANLELFHIPFISILVCLICTGVYYAQFKNESKFVEAMNSFCEKKPSRTYRMVLKKTLKRSAGETCHQVMWDISRAPDPRKYVEDEIVKDASFVGYGGKAGKKLMVDAFMDEYKKFARATPDFLTPALWYEPRHLSIPRMLTAALSHGSWGHLIGNLFFFFAFAATVEIILGWWKYILFLTALAVGTALTYSLTSLGVADPRPTLGLSGVVMGVMGMFAWFLPWGRVRCFIWLVVIFKRINVPAWMLFAWYIGWDLYALNTGEGNAGVNMVAHVSGGLLGLGLGTVFFRKRKREILEEIAV